MKASKPLIEFFVPPRGSGQLISFTGSTYVLSSDFLVQDLLPTLAQLRSRHQDLTVGLPEIVKVAEGAQIGIVVDRFHYSEIDGVFQIIDIVVHPKRRQHSKVFIIHWENLVRAIVTSANLTTDGVRWNREVAVVFDYHKDGSASPSILQSLVAGFKDQFGTAMTRGMEESLNACLVASKAFGRGRQSSSGPKILWGGHSDPLLKRIMKEWPDGEKITEIRIVSPFWPVGNITPFKMLREILKEKNASSGRLSLKLHCVGRPYQADQFRPEFPLHAKKELKHWVDVDIALIASDPRVSRDDVPDRFKESEYSANRFLHAKTIIVKGTDHVLLSAGSANFTESALASVGEDSNIEVMAVWLLPVASYEKFLKQSLIPPIAASLDLADCEDEELAEPDPQKDSPPWPDFLQRVEMSIKTPVLEWKDGEEVAVMTMEYSPPLGSDGRYGVRVTDSSDPLSIPPSSSTSCTFSQILLSEEARILLSTREITVFWPLSPDGTKIPINLDASAKSFVPVTGISKPLTEEQLLAFFKGMTGIEGLSDYQPRDIGLPGDDPKDESDFKQTLQLYRVRDFIEGLRGLREELQDSLLSIQRMRKAFLMEISPVALGGSIVEEYNTGKRSKVAAAFQLLELISTVRGIEIPNGDSSKAKVRSDCIEKLTQMYERIRQSPGTELDDSFKKFEEAIKGKRY